MEPLELDEAYDVSSEPDEVKTSEYRLRDVFLSFSLTIRCPGDYAQTFISVARTLYGENDDIYLAHIPRWSSKTLERIYSPSKHQINHLINTARVRAKLKGHLIHRSYYVVSRNCFSTS